MRRYKQAIALRQVLNTAAPRRYISLRIGLHLFLSRAIVDRFVSLSKRWMIVPAHLV